MATYTDVLEARYNFIIDNALTNIDIILDKFRLLQQASSNITGLKKAEKDLREIGLAAKKTGQLYDLLTGKFVSSREALNRMQTLESKGTFFGKSAADIGGITDATPATKKPVGEAQRLVDLVGKEMRTAAMQGQEALEKMGEKGSFAVQKIQNRMKELQEAQMRKMGFMFGALFGGMQVQRFGLSIMRFVLPSMEKLENYTSDGTKRINAMNASFQFLKFSMFEALTNSELFKSFVDITINLVNWLSEMVAKYPVIAQIAAAFGAILVAVGSLGIAAGFITQISMLSDSIKVLWLNAKLAKGGILGMFTNLKLLKGVAAGLTIAAGAFLAWEGIKGTMNFAKEMNSSWKDYLKSSAFTIIGLTLLGAGIGSVVPGVGTAFGALFGFIAGVAFSITAVVGDLMKEKDFDKKVSDFLESNNVEGTTMTTRDGQTITFASKDIAAAELLSNNYEDISRGINQINTNLDAGVYSQEDAIEAVKKRNQLEADLADVIEMGTILDGDRFRTKINNINDIIALEEKWSEEKQLAQEQEKVNEDIIISKYEDKVSNIAQSAEKTQDFSNNMNTLLDLFTSNLMETSISNLQLIDSTWIDATTHMQEFADKLDAWASKVVTKTVQIKYKESNKPSRTSGFFGTLGSAIDRTFSNASRSD